MEEKLPKQRSEIKICNTRMLMETLDKQVLFAIVSLIGS